jgi:hypothetical protein
MATPYEQDVREKLLAACDLHELMQRTALACSAAA